MNRLYILPLLLVAFVINFYSTSSAAPSNAAALKVQANPANAMALPANQQAGKVSGEVTYNSRVALPDNAVITVQLQDLSRSDGAIGIVNEQIIQSGGRQPPIAFELSYDPNAINPNSTYNVYAKITVDGNLIFVLTMPCYVITKSRPTTVKLMLSAATGAQSNLITGRVTYRDPLLLPPNAIVTVQLVDLSRQGTGANVRGEYVAQTNGQQVPLAYAIHYNPATIRPSDYYAVRATITVDGRVWFISRTNYLVLTHGHDKTVNLTLTKII